MAQSSAAAYHMSHLKINTQKGGLRATSSHSQPSSIELSPNSKRKAAKVLIEINDGVRVLNVNSPTEVSEEAGSEIGKNQWA